VHQQEVAMPEPLTVVAPVTDEVVLSGDLIEWETGPNDVFCEIWFGPAGLTGNLGDLAVLEDSCIVLASVPDYNCTGRVEVPELEFTGESADCSGEIVITRKRWDDDLPTYFGSSMTIVEQRIRVPVIFKRQGG
jgi:hypothetical protein